MKFLLVVFPSKVLLPETFLIRTAFTCSLWLELWFCAACRPCKSLRLRINRSTFIKINSTALCMFTWIGRSNFKFLQFFNQLFHGCIDISRQLCPHNRNVISYCNTLFLLATSSVLLLTICLFVIDILDFANSSLVYQNKGVLACTCWQIHLYVPFGGTNDNLTPLESFRQSHKMFRVNVLTYAPL